MIQVQGHVKTDLYRLSCHRHSSCLTLYAQSSRSSNRHLEAKICKMYQTRYGAMLVQRPMHHSKERRCRGWDLDPREAATSKPGETHELQRLGMHAAVYCRRPTEHTRTHSPKALHESSISLDHQMRAQNLASSSTCRAAAKGPACMLSNRP